jgi:hypothetical protein
MVEELKKERDYLLRGHKAIFNQHPSKRALQKHIKELWKLIEQKENDNA